MGRYNEIQTGRVNRFLQKFSGVKGSPPVPTIAGELQPSINIHSGVESLNHQGWNKYGFTTFVALQAANQSGARIRNPITSNIIAVLEKITTSISAPTRVIGAFGAVNVDLFATTTASFSRFDPRGNPQPVCILSNANNAPGIPLLPNFFWDQLLSTNLPVDLILDNQQEIPLLPGDACQVFSANINTTIEVTYWWRERFLEDTERT